MIRLDQEDTLSEGGQVVLILRLAIDRQARLRHGELVDVDGAVQGRFRNLQELLGVLRQWLDRQADERALAADSPV